MYLTTKTVWHFKNLLFLNLLFTNFTCNTIILIEIFITWFSFESYNRSLPHKSWNTSVLDVSMFAIVCLSFTNHFGRNKIHRPSSIIYYWNTQAKIIAGIYYYSQLSLVYNMVMEPSLKYVLKNTAVYLIFFIWIDILKKNF